MLQTDNRKKAHNSNTPAAAGMLFMSTKTQVVFLPPGRRYGISISDLLKFYQIRMHVKYAFLDSGKPNKKNKAI